MLTFQRALLRGRCRISYSDRGDGDANDDTFGGWARASWTLLHQVHGADVVVVGEPGEHRGASADAAVTATPGAALVIRTADCVPIALYNHGAVGAVHAGWKGLEAGVVERSVAALSELADGPVRAVVGPHIHAGCYEFGASDLRRLATRFGDAVVGVTSDGNPALDLVAALDAEFDRLDVGLDHHLRACTGCGDRWFSHRARADPQRLAMCVELKDS